MEWKGLLNWLVIPLAFLVFAIPLLVGRQYLGGEGQGVAWHPLAFRGLAIQQMWAGSSEGLTRLYVWGPSVGLRRSIDGGRTWSEHLEKGLPHDALGRVPLEGIGLVPMDTRIVVAGLHVGNAAVLYRLQADNTWQKVRTVAEPVQGPLLMTQAPSGQYLAWGHILWRWMEENGEESWHIMHKWEKSPITAMANTGGESPALLVYAGQLWRSTDGGETWYALPDAPDGIRALRAPAHAAGVFYALARGRVWQSTDGGNTWTNISPPGEAIAIDVPPIYRQVLYALDRSGQVWRYGPAADRWVEVGSLGPRTARLLLADPTEPGLLYVGGDDGLWMGEDLLPPVTPTPTPTYTFTPLPPTSTPTSSPTPTATPTPTTRLTHPTNTPTPTPSPTPSPTPTHTPTLRPTPTPQPTPTPLPSPTNTPTPVPTPPPTPTWTPTWTPTATATFTPNLPPTNTPTPTRTPGPPPER